MSVSAPLRTRDASRCAAWRRTASSHPSAVQEPPRSVTVNQRPVLLFKTVARCARLTHDCLGELGSSAGHLVTDGLRAHMNFCSLHAMCQKLLTARACSWAMLATFIGPSARIEALPWARPAESTLIPGK